MAKQTRDRVPGRARGPIRKPAPEPAPTQQGYYMYPTIHGERIVFCSDDDLWTIGPEGGVARRLTVSKGSVSRPVLSPGGETIAFAGSDEGMTEVYVVPAAGGEPRRLTHLGAMTYPVAWSSDGAEVIFASDTAQPFVGDYQLHAVAATGGPVRPLRLGPARGFALEPGGPGAVLARNGGDPARWKRYRGGTVGTLWVDRTGRGEYTQILKTLKGNLASPLWIGGRIYFVSDHEGTGNLYSVRPDGRGAIQRHTHHADFYVRFPGSDGRRIVYHAGADLYLFDPETSVARRLAVEIRSPRPQRQMKFASGSQFEDYDPHPAGHSVALTVRGRPIVMGFWEGPATEFGAPWRGRHRLARWLSDGKRLVAVTDTEGEERLEIFTPGAGVEQLDLDVDLGRAIDLLVAPAPPAPKGRRGRGRTKPRAKGAVAHDCIAITNQRQELFIIDLTARTARRIDVSRYHRIGGLAWSPDGRYLAYGLAIDRRHMVIRVAEAASGKTQSVTSGDFIDYEPCFDPEGRYLYFLSLRTYDPVYDLLQFGLGFPRGARPCLITLRAEDLSPFKPAPRALGGGKDAPTSGQNPWEVAAGNDQPGAMASRPPRRESKAEPVRIDFEGIVDRVLAFPVPEGRYRQVRAIAGKAFFLSDPIEGALGQMWVPSAAPSAKSSIEVYDLREQKGATFASGVSNFDIAADRKTLVYRAGTQLRAVLATSEPGKLPAGEEAGRATGWLDLERARCAIEPAREWRQILAETWRLQRDQFWVPDMSRIDWEGVFRRYLPLVDRLSTRRELSDLIWEMQGELGTSHAYEVGGDFRIPPAYGIGFLGADIALDAKSGCWQVVRIPAGDSWTRAASPLAAPGLRIVPGTRIHTVAGLEVGPSRSPHECLVNLAGREVWLTISDPGPRAARGAKPRTAEPRTVTVTTLPTEYALRYRDWVEGNRAWVHRESGGKIGYVHVPNMGPQGYAEFHRYFLNELDRRGLIIDVRHNGGGHVSSLLLEKLMRKRVGYSVSRHMGLEPYPNESPRGPMVALTDELAGSDGDIFSHSWKLYRLGPLVGKRTWGGVIGIWPRHILVDGSITTQPEFSFWFEDVGWGVENYGTDPDIEVDMRPQDYAAGRDPQLARALAVVTRLERDFREKLPDMRARPNLAPPRLPI
jgi:tricorn protease